MKTVLVVDDSASMRALVVQTLQTSGFKTVEATNGQEALDQVKVVGKLDLVITDLNMPVMDGVTFVQKLRALVAFKYTPVLMLKNETRQDKKEKEKAAGEKGWLKKKFDDNKMIAVVKRVIK